MKKNSVFGLIATIAMLSVVGCTVKETNLGGCESADLKPVIYLYPTQDNTEITVTLDYNGTLTTLDPEFNIENGWKVTATTGSKITLGEKTYDYLYWEGNPNNQYNFFSGFCIKGSETESFLNEELHYLGLNDAETKAFIDYWLPQMKDNEYNVISFQEGAYTNNARLKIDPEPESVIRVFMAWYPSQKHVKILPQYLDGAARHGYSVVEWGGNKVK